MATTSELQETLSKFKMAQIIEQLAGDKDNLRVDIQKVKFTVKNQGFEVDGTVNFNVIHKGLNPHLKDKEK
jgi:uncharacterized protein YcgL (UPF0745 family)